MASGGTGSPAGSLSQYDLGRVALHAAQLAAGAAATYLGEWATGQDWGAYQPLVVAGVTVLIDFVRRWASDTRRGR